MSAPRAARDGAQREELVAAAARVLAREGVPAATTRRIAAEAGIPLGKIHYWFATKDDLMAEVVRDHVGRIQDAVASAQDDAAPATDRMGGDPVPDPGSGHEAGDRAGHEDGDQDEAGRLLDLFRAAFSVDAGTERGTGLVPYELLTWALRTPGHEELATRQAGAFRDAARAASATWHAEHGTAAGIDADVLAQLLASLYDGLVLAWLADPDGTDPDAVFGLLSRMLTAVGQPPPEQPGQPGQPGQPEER